MKWARAYFIVLDPRQAHLQPEQDPLSHIIYSAKGADVTDVYVQGRHVVKNRECIYLDEEKVVYEANKALSRLKTV